jgi:hemoglobin
MFRAPHPKSLGVEAGITETMIRGLVHAFYARVRRDEILGPIVNAKVDDWDDHLDKLCTFWSSVTLMTGSKGRPMEVHALVPGISHAHFDRWLALFRDTARDLCPPEAAKLFINRAERIAESLKLGIAIPTGTDCP